MSQKHATYLMKHIYTCIHSAHTFTYAPICMCVHKCMCVCIYVDVCMGIYECMYILCMGFPDGSVVKNLPAMQENTGSIPVSGRSSGRGNGSTPVFLPGKYHG